MVASLVTLFKKLKFVTDENVGWGPIDLPELELQTTAYWLTAEGAATGWRRDELDVALLGAGRAIQAVAAVLLMVDPRDLGLVTQVRSPHHEAPTIYLYEAMPGGVGLSERLWARHDELVAGAADLIAACPCEAGCPACTGPRLEPEVDGKALALRLLAAARRRSARPAGAAAASHDRSRPRGAGVDLASGGSRTCGRRSPAGRGAARRPEPRGRRSRARSPALAARLAAALGARGRATTPDGWLVRRVDGAGRRCPVDRERLARAAGPPARRTRRWSASTRRRPGWRRRPARSRSSSASAGGRAPCFRQIQLLLPDHADEPALLAELAPLDHRPTPGS